MVGEALGTRLLRLGLLHEADHRGELGIGPYRGGLDDQAAVHHDRAPHDRGRRIGTDRLGLTGHGAHIDRRAAVDNDSVSCDGFPRPRHEALALLEFARRYH
ncbi:Uncharacterised protein [Mycobacterium tuberculosis]|nr:Uncharacterised protein [Mycobacterium tuberculosis]CKR56018.1 Uncharacterised protein [Mycobacterium tuberculosis]CNL41606.1 Uncharacterised protein [Mycobacterium tuberculosis]CNN11106.1 Uncharacterised protein [Mycobacterium tuberculosis]CNU23524.1 Uncharacterised protein [Mycobacterium tuberculosis]